MTSCFIFCVVFQARTYGSEDQVFTQQQKNDHVHLDDSHVVQTRIELPRQFNKICNKSTGHERNEGDCKFKSVILCSVTQSLKNRGLLQFFFFKYKVFTTNFNPIQMFAWEDTEGTPLMDEIGLSGMSLSRWGDGDAVSSFARFPIFSFSAW